MFATHATNQIIASETDTHGFINPGEDFLYLYLVCYVSNNQNHARSLCWQYLLRVQTQLALHALNVRLIDIELFLDSSYRICALIVMYQYWNIVRFGPRLNLLFDLVFGVDTIVDWHVCVRCGNYDSQLFVAYIRIF